MMEGKVAVSPTAVEYTRLSVLLEERSNFLLKQEGFTQDGFSLPERDAFPQLIFRTAAIWDELRAYLDDATEPDGKRTVEVLDAEIADLRKEAFALQQQTPNTQVRDRVRDFIMRERHFYQRVSVLRVGAGLGLLLLRRGD